MRKMELRDIQIACGFRKVPEIPVPFKRFTLMRRSKGSTMKSIEYLDGEENMHEDFWEDFWEEDLILPSPVRSNLDFDMGLEIRKPFYPGLISVIENNSDESEVYTVASTPSSSSDSASLVSC